MNIQRIVLGLIFGKQHRVC